MRREKQNYQTTDITFGQHYLEKRNDQAKLSGKCRQKKKKKKGFSAVKVRLRIIANRLLVRVKNFFAIFFRFGGAGVTDLWHSFALFYGDLHTHT